jgi:hypothetical protein
VIHPVAFRYRPSPLSCIASVYCTKPSGVQRIQFASISVFPPHSPGALLYNRLIRVLSPPPQVLQLAFYNDRLLSAADKGVPESTIRHNDANLRELGSLLIKAFPVPPPPPPPEALPPAAAAGFSWSSFGIHARP